MVSILWKINKCPKVDGFFMKLLVFLGKNYIYIYISYNIIMFYFFTIFWVGQKVLNIGFGIANNEVYMNYELIPKTIKNDM
jgi:hypothetical protein